MRALLFATLFLLTGCDAFNSGPPELNIPDDYTYTYSRGCGGPYCPFSYRARITVEGRTQVTEVTPDERITLTDQQRAQVVAQAPTILDVYAESLRHENADYHPEYGYPIRYSMTFGDADAENGYSIQDFQPAD